MFIMKDFFALQKENISKKSTRSSMKKWALFTSLGFGACFVRIFVSDGYACRLYLICRRKNETEMIKGVTFFYLKLSSDFFLSPKNPP